MTELIELDWIHRIVLDDWKTIAGLVVPGKVGRRLEHHVVRARDGILQGRRGKELGRGRVGVARTGGVIGEGGGEHGGPRERGDRVSGWEGHAGLVLIVTCALRASSRGTVN